MTDKSVEFSIVDVFTDTQFSGNPVAVIHDGRGLTTEEMQKISIEFGFSETTFICPPKSDQYTAEVRIFTPLEEIPFAGHPNIGTAFVVGNETTAAGPPISDRFVFDELGGEVRGTMVVEGETTRGASIAAPQSLQRLGLVPPETIAGCLGLKRSDILGASFPPMVASVGLPFAFAQISTLERLGDIQCDIGAFRDAANTGPRTVDGFAICAFVIIRQDTDGSLNIRSRVLSPLGVPPEDPATGSAAAALCGILSEDASNDVARFHVTQGVEMGRRSEIHVRIDHEAQRTTITGRCAKVARGTLTLANSGST